MEKELLPPGGPGDLPPDLRLSPITLNFPDDLEREYQDHLFRSFVPNIRLSLLLGLFLYASFGLLDHYMAPEVRDKLWFIRFAVVCPAIAVYLACSYIKGFQKIYQPATALIALLGSTGILAMMLLVPTPLDATYCAGLMLVLFYIYSMLKIRVLLAGLVGWATVAGYFAAVPFLSVAQWVVISNAFFLISANIVGMFTCWFTDRHTRESFRYMCLLAEEKDKSQKTNRKLVREMTERRRNELRLANSERSLRNVFDAVDGALIILDQDGEVLDVNRKMLKMFEGSREELMKSADWTQFSSPQNPSLELQAHFVNALAGQPVRFEWKGRRIRSGREFHLEAAMSRVRIDGKVRILVTAHDITDRKRAEELRGDMERMSRHDLKAPLNSILAFPSILLEDRDDLTDDQRRMLSAIESAGYRMLDMINRSQTLYKLESGAYEYDPVDVDLLSIARKAAEDVLLPLEAACDEIRFTVADQPPISGEKVLVPGEELLLYTMVANLLKNAVEASGPDVPVRVAMDQGSDVVRLSVTNTGEVPKDFRPIFFDKYATEGKKAGSGLGTYSARLIAKVHGGLVKLDASTPGMTTVIVLLPGKN